MSDKPPHVLFCSAVNPFRNRSGEEIRAKSIIRSLVQVGCKVTVLANTGNGASPETPGTGGLVSFQEGHLKRPKSLAILPQLFLKNPRFLASAKITAAGASPDIVFLDWGHLGQYVNEFRRLGCRVVIGTHNVESQLTGQVPVSNAFGWTKREIRRMLESAHERLFFPRADVVIHVSPSDAEVYRSYIPTPKLFYLPNFVEESDEALPPQRAQRIIMTGSFSNFQNREALRWFLTAVWDNQLADLTQLCIAGSHSEEILAELGNFPGVRALGEIEDMRREIRMSKCAIVPILHGSGTRIKCLEAMAERTPIVSTTLGAEGLNTDGTVWLANKPADFKQAIIDVLTSPEAACRRAEAAHEVFLSEYSLRANLTRIRVLIQRLCPHYLIDAEKHHLNNQNSSAEVEMGREDVHHIPANRK